MKNDQDIEVESVKIKNVSFDTEPGNFLTSLFRRVSSFSGYREKKDYDGLQAYVMFLGYPRSGHTLVGSLLDAHPSCMISHELDALYYIKSGYSKYQLFHLIKKNTILFEKNGRKWMGYDYNVESEDLGRDSVLTHIGDKCGGRSTRRLGLPGQDDLLERLERTIQLPIKIIHVIRNPYDNISTMGLRIKENTDRLLHNTLNNAIKRYANNLRINQEVRGSGRFDMIDMHLQDLVQDPGLQVSRLCDFLKLPMTEEYKKACESKVWDKVSESRFKIKEYWNNEERQKVEMLISSYDFLRPYQNTVI